MAKKERKRLRLTKRQAIAGAVVLAIIAVALYFIFRKRPQPEVHPTVVVETVTTDDMEIYGEYVGRIRAQQFVEIRARVEGYLEEMLFEEGTYIKKDQVLFVIDPKLYKARVDGARAQLQKDKALELKAKRDLDRIRPLFEQNAASQLDLDNAIAPYDIGTLVGPGGKSLLATIVKSDTVRVDFSMTALDYLRSKERNVNLGHQDPTRGWNPYITVTLADDSVYPYEGLVDFADPQVDPQTGTFSVRAEMPNPDHVLLPGQFTKVKLLLDVREGAVVVPSKAVIIEKGGAFIYVIRPDNVAERRFIELGPETDNMMIVERGLIPGERIVVEGYHKLMPGMTVEIVEPVAGEAAAEGMDNNAEE